MIIGGSGMSDYSARDIIIWLNSIEISNSTIKKLLAYFPDLRDILDIDSDRLHRIPGIKKEHIESIISNREYHNIENLLKELEDKGIRVLTFLDDDYPAPLNNIHDSPSTLYYQGEFKDEDRIAIAIVGARKSTAYGRWVCEKFTKELVDLGITIVSGLALGIDSIAHKTALKYDGRTIGVLGNGLDVRYPKNNIYLYDEIIKNGLVLTEFSIGTQPLAYNFPKRNRIISGLSLGVIVIEAKERSGSLITAHHALEQGKDVFAVPGNINSIYSGGTNKLIRDGAIPLLDIDDILDEIYELKQRTLIHNDKEIDYSDLGEIEIMIVELLKEGPLHCDLIVHKTGLGISVVISALTILELKGVIKELTSRTYSIS